MGALNAGLDANKINATTENFLKNQHGIHIPADKIHTTMDKRGRAVELANRHVSQGAPTPNNSRPPNYNQQVVDYDQSSDSSYIHIPQF
jgi:hypothetical protein